MREQAKSRLWTNAFESALTSGQLTWNLQDDLIGLHGQPVQNQIQELEIMLPLFELKKVTGKSAINQPKLCDPPTFGLL
jgi:hypothetical protein